MLLTLYAVLDGNQEFFNHTMIQRKAFATIAFYIFENWKQKKKIILRENFKANSDRWFDIQLGYDYSSEIESCTWNYVLNSLNCMYFQQLKNQMQHTIFTIKS